MSTTSKLEPKHATPQCSKLTVMAIVKEKVKENLLGTDAFSSIAAVLKSQNTSQLACVRCVIQITKIDCSSQYHHAHDVVRSASLSMSACAALSDGFCGLVERICRRENKIGWSACAVLSSWACVGWKSLQPD